MLKMLKKLFVLEAEAYTHTHIYMYIFIAADAAEWQLLFTIEKQTKQNKKQAKIYILSAKMT